MRAKEHKKLSEDKERYKYKKVLTKNGIPIPGLWQRLGKFSVYVSIVRNGRIVPTFIPLKAKTLQKAIDECQKLQAFWAKERNNFKIHEITEDALKEEVYLLLMWLFSELITLMKKAPSIYNNYLEDNEVFLKRFESMFQVVCLTSRILEILPEDLKNNPSEEQVKSFVNQLADEQLISTYQTGIARELLDQKTRKSIDILFKQVVQYEYDDDDAIGFKSSLDTKLENILKLLTELKTKHNNSEADIKEGENFSKALEHYQKSRRKAEGLAFGTKSNTAFKIIQRVIYPLETQIRILKALLRYCPKEEQQASKS